MPDRTSSLLAAYLDRVGVAHPGSPSLATLRLLHSAHAAAIPFENLDILLGRGISLDLDHLRRKLVDSRRGGYCFEHNTLFHAVLSELGFEVTPMEARVRGGTVALRPRTHMVLGVRLAGGEWLADVGFGGEGPRLPVPMDAIAARPDEGNDPSYRVVAEDRLRVLQMQRGGEWLDQYAFLPEGVHPVDFEVANWYTSAHPHSPFVRNLTAQRAARDVRYVLRYPIYTEIRGDEIRSREIARDELHGLLRDVFLIDVPENSIFPAIDGAVPAQPAL
jgi:N-hydroxyarylamine O-acetyltransferase